MRSIQYVNRFKFISMKTAHILTVALFVVGIFLQSCDNKSNSPTKTDMDTSMANHSDHKDMKNMGHEMSQSMRTMMASMNAVKMTGDFDLDFANMMIPHHQSAVDMALEYLPMAKDEKIKLMAQDIIALQKKEIKELETIVANYKPIAGNSGDGANVLMQAMDKMMEEMTGMKMSGNADKDFLVMMIPHHESAVTMSKDELLYGKNLELKKLAQKILDEQKKEISQFKEWLKDN